MSKLEKTELEICLIPIICSAPLIYAHRQGFFERNGLHVALRRAPGWSGVKELLVHGKVDAAHMLSPMPLACNLGIDGKKADIRLAAIQNVNGQALTLSKKHLGIAKAEEMKGFSFGVPYLYSMHYYLLCYFLAENGVDPLNDVSIQEVSPPRMPYYLEKGWVDGVFAPDPFNQIAVHRDIGFIYMLSKEIWPGHPCCGFATTGEFIQRYPHTYQAMLRSVLEAQLALFKAGIEQRKTIAREICDAQHLNQEDSAPVEQALSGDFPDGKGRHHTIPDRISFVPFPREEYGTWILSQMQRWAQLPGKINYRKVVKSVFETESTNKLAEALGFPGDLDGDAKESSAFVEKDPFSRMLSQPYCAYQKKPHPLKQHDLPVPARGRLSEIVDHLADMAGGTMAAKLEITAEGEIGLLERSLNETLLNVKFISEALAEERDKLEDRVKERTAALQREIAQRSEAEAKAVQMAREILELSTPVIEVWKGILVTPLIGTLDSERTQQFMERLLNAIVHTKSTRALVDITGVPTVDTQTAQHLLEAVTAAQLLGARVILTGISPTIAQTITHLGIDLSNISTQSSLTSGFRLALDELALEVKGKAGSR